MNALGKYRVVDFTEGDYGKVCTEYLGLLGMDVVRIDHPADRTNRCEFVTYNMNKTCIQLDHTTAEGREKLAELLVRADVFVENRDYDFMASLGLDYETLSARNPGIVYASMKPFPTGSRWQGYKTNHAIIHAMSGASYLNGYIGNDPVEPGPDLADTSTSSFTATGILAALYQRESSGRGQYIQVSQQEALIAHERSAFEKFHKIGKNPRVGNLYPTRPDTYPVGLFPTKSDDPESMVLILCFDQKMFELLADAMGMPELKEDERFRDFDARARNQNELRKIVSAWTRQYDKFEIMRKLMIDSRVTCAAICSIEDIVRDEDLREMGMIQQIRDKEAGEMWLPTFPAIFSGLAIKARAPLTGEEALARALDE